MSGKRTTLGAMAALVLIGGVAIGQASPSDSRAHAKASRLPPPGELPSASPTTTALVRRQCGTFGGVACMTDSKARLPRAAWTGGTLRATLPARGDGWVQLENTTARFHARVRLPSSAQASPARVGDLVAYEHRGTPELLVRATPDVYEDFVVLPDASSQNEVRYQLDVTGVAGLRLVANVLELLDATGTPRLRMAPPVVVDAEEARRAATVDVQGCAVDRSPRAPWGRAPTAAGAPICTVSVRWDAAGLRYPAVLDPKWTATGEMIEARYGHAAIRLKDDRVLVAGGYWVDDGGGSNLIELSELYDRATETWSATAPLLNARRAPQAVLLNDGRVFLAGGCHEFDLCAQQFGEFYDPGTGLWAAVKGEPVLEGASVTLLEDGRALVAGGAPTPWSPPYKAYLLDPNVAVHQQPLPDMPVATKSHCAVRLLDGRVLLAGGSTNGSGGPVMMFDPKTLTWSVRAPLSQARYPVGVLLPDGRVFVSGSCGPSIGCDNGTAEIYEPSTDTWSVIPAQPRAGHGVVLLTNGTVLLGGGLWWSATGPTNFVPSEIFDPASNTYSPLPDEAQALRAGHGTTLLADGTVLFSGGLMGDLPTATAIVLVLSPTSPTDGGTGEDAGGIDAAMGGAPGDDGGSAVVACGAGTSRRGNECVADAGCGCGVPAGSPRVGWAVLAALVMCVRRRGAVRRKRA